MKTDIRLVKMIRDLRQLHYRIGKRKVKPILDKYALILRINPIATDTIGKITKRHNLFFQKHSRMYHNSNSKRCDCQLNYKPKIKRSPQGN